MGWNEPISERQVELINKLYLEIDPEFGTKRAMVFIAENPTRREASAKIDTLIDQAKKAKAARAAAPEPTPVLATVFDAPAVPAKRPDLVYPEPGYYAVPYAGALRFYRVKEGTGYRAGRFFLDRFKSDELRYINRTEQCAVLDLINADPDEAGMRFAVELTRCRCCGRMLTDEVSRLRGIGPDCLGRRQGRDLAGITFGEA